MTDDLSHPRVQQILEDADALRRQPQCALTLALAAFS